MLDHLADEAQVGTLAKWHHPNSSTLMFMQACLWPKMSLMLPRGNTRQTMLR